MKQKRKRKRTKKKRTNEWVKERKQTQQKKNSGFSCMWRCVLFACAKDRTEREREKQLDWKKWCACLKILIKVSLSVCRSISQWRGCWKSDVHFVMMCTPFRTMKPCRQNKSMYKNMRKVSNHQIVGEKREREGNATKSTRLRTQVTQIKNEKNREYVSRLNLS